MKKKKAYLSAEGYLVRVYQLSLLLVWFSIVSSLIRAVATLR